MPTYCTFEIELADFKPRIWRRLLIRTDASFLDLHRAIQDSFGWQDSHLFEFREQADDGLSIAGTPVDDDESDDPIPDAGEVRIEDHFGDASSPRSCDYVYDFGDNWLHELRLLGVHSDAGRSRRRLLDGARSGPPEDCGGVPGYERLVEFLRTGEDPHGEDPDDLREWLRDWRPDGFELREAGRGFDE